MTQEVQNCRSLSKGTTCMSSNILPLVTRLMRPDEVQNVFFICQNVVQREGFPILTEIHMKKSWFSDVDMSISRHRRIKELKHVSLFLTSSVNSLCSSWSMEHWYCRPPGRDRIVLVAQQRKSIHQNFKEQIFFI